MTIFIDTSKSEEIKEFHKMGIIRGVTTNPTIMLKNGVTGGFKGILKKTEEIAAIVYPYPVSVEVLTNDKKDMIEQAKIFAAVSDNINIKITIHGPEGELENIEAIHELENNHNIRVNVTAMMSAQQCLIAALAGATYVSLFGGRVNNMGHSSIDEIKKTRQLLDMHELKSKIIIGSTREILNISEWLLAGAHIVTSTPELIKGMIIHPYSKETVQMFINDAAALTEGKLIHAVS